MGPAVDIDFNIDVTSFVQNWQADPSTNHGFRLRLDDGFVGAAFDHTGENAPMLLVTQVIDAAVPEPTTAVMVWTLLSVCGIRRPSRRMHGRR